MRLPTSNSRFRLAARPRRTNGFSLVELTVVLVILAVMVLLILPELRGTFEGELLRSTGRQLTRAMHLAYSQSVTVHQPHRVRIDTREGRYVLERPAEEGSSNFVPLRDLPGAEGKLDPRITLEIRPRMDATEGQEQGMEPPPPAPDDSAGPGQWIAFYPDGTADPREILLRDREGFGFALRINPVTARVNLEDLERQ